MCHNFSCVTLNLLAISRSSTVLDETAHPSTASYLLLHLLRRITKQPKLTAIIQSQHLSIFGQIARSQDDPNCSPPENWKRPPGRPRITWLNTIQQDMRAYNLILNEAVDLAQKRPLWRLMSTYGAMHS